MSMSDASIPVFEIGLNALAALLDKAEAYAEAKRIDPAAVLKARIAKTSAFLKTLDARRVDASADREITFPLGPRKGHMRGADYLNHFALPNFHFHRTTAYDILRHCGLEIGKLDYLGAVPMRVTGLESR